MRLAAKVGLLRGEIARVHTRDLFEATGGAQLLFHGKGGTQRVVPISAALAETIRLATPVEGWLFPNGRGDHLTAYHVGDLAVRALQRPWTLHTLRHRFASRAYRDTRDLLAVQVLPGHESIATTERYAAVDDCEICAAMAAAIAE